MEPEPVEPHVVRAGRPRFDDGRSELRECRRHGLIEHRLFREGRDRSRWRCRRCVGEAVTRRHHKVRSVLLEAAGGRCVVCGYDRCRVNLHFHHVEPEHKAFALTMAGGRSLAAYLEEARKCVLVCANCHGEIETGLIPSPPIGTGWQFGDDADPP